MHESASRSIEAVQQVDDASNPNLLAARILAEIATVISGVHGLSGILEHRSSVEGSGNVTIPIGARFYSYSAVGGSITVAGVTRPEGVSNSVSIPGGLSHTIAIANVASGVAHWSYVL